MDQRAGQRGQAMIEAALALPIVLAAILAVGMISYACLAYYSVDYHLHEALVCATHKASYTCERDLRKRIVNSLPFGKITDLDVHSENRGARGRVRVQLVSGKHDNPILKNTDLKIEKAIELPR
jgi:hypothetical protein